MKYILRYIGLLLTLICAAPVVAAEAQVWSGSWATSQMPVDASNKIDPTLLQDATLRQTIRVSAGGHLIRLRLSNAFGTAPLRISGVHVARAVASGQAVIIPTTDRAVTFNGLESVTIPAGAEYISDPVAFDLVPVSDVAITIHLKDVTVVQTGHPGSRTTSYILPGRHLSDTDVPGANKMDRWYLISALDVADMPGMSIAILGDSITDGHSTTTNGNDRWTDILSARLNTGSAKATGILNFGIGGNRILNDGLGPNAMSRVTRDVLGQSGVRTLIVFEGVNDLGTLTREAPVSDDAHAALVARLIGAYKQIILMAHAHGIKVIGATILPYGGSDYYHPTAENEKDRLALNAWIRARGNFDAVIDFDALLRDPAHPERLAPAYDSGDHIHPSPAGYRVMGLGVPLEIFHK